VTVEGKSAYGIGVRVSSAPVGEGRPPQPCWLRSRPWSASPAGRRPGRPLTTMATATGPAVSGPSSLLRPHHPVRWAGLRSTARHADLQIDAVYLATGANDPTDLIADSSHPGAQPLIVPSPRYAPDDKADIAR